MKIGIVYGTRRNAATVEIVEWMTEHFTSLEYGVACAKPEDYNDFGCDLYVLGTAVYAFSAKRTGLNTFIRKHHDRIVEKPVAVFIVCGADPLDPVREVSPLKRGLKTLFLNREKYLASVTSLLVTPPVSTAFFKGYQEPKDRDEVGFVSQKQRVAQWCDSMLATRLE